MKNTTTPLLQFNQPMCTFNKRANLGVFFLFLLLLLPPAPAPACEVRVRVPEGNTYVPFFIKDKTSGKWDGLSIELTEVLLSEAGCTPVYQTLPFSRAISYLEQGTIDLMTNLTDTEERKAFTSFIGPQLDETVLLVIRKEAQFNITSIDDLKNLPAAIGVERGKVYGATFEEKRAKDPLLQAKLEVVNEVDLNEKKLAIGRISGFLGFGYNVMQQMRVNPLYKDFAIHPFVINRDWVYFGFSKKSISPVMLEKLQNAYDRLVKRGEFEKIRQKYTINHQ